MAAIDPLKVLVVANKNWEAEPLVGVLAGKRPRPKRLELVGEPVFPALTPEKLATEELGNGIRLTNCAGRPRARLKLHCPGVGTNAAPAAVEIWCIEDWMSHASQVSSSSSHDKWTRALPTIAEAAFPGASGRAAPPDLVIAFGTAGMPGHELVNGCVSVGSRVFVSDPFWDAPDARQAAALAGNPMLDIDALGLAAAKGIVAVPTSRLKAGEVFRRLPDAARLAAEGCFLAPPVLPAQPLRIFAGTGFAALSTINVTNYDDFVWTDEYTRTRFEELFRQREVGSMETTHGLIRARWPSAAFLFVSGVTDRVPLFNQEVTPRVYAQNFACAHNAGVTLAFLLPELLDLHAQGKLL